MLSFSHIVLILLIALLQLSYGASIEVDPGNVAVVMSRGRSGSTELMSLIRNIAEGSISSELFGSTEKSMCRLDNPLEHMLSFLSKRQKLHPTSLAGFKWKPYCENEKYLPVWQWFSETGAKIIYNHRNPLDVFISVSRSHLDSAEFNCKVGNTACVEKQKSLKIKLDVDHVVDYLNKTEAIHNEILNKFRNLKINYFPVTYEGINHGTLSERLALVQRLADFLLPQGNNNKSEKRVRPDKNRKKKRVVVTEAVFETGTEYIGHYHQNETVLNYDELVAALKGTPYEKLLH